MTNPTKATDFSPCGWEIVPPGKRTNIPTDFAIGFIEREGRLEDEIVRPETMVQVHAARIDGHQVNDMPNTIEVIAAGAPINVETHAALSQGEPIVVWTVREAAFAILFAAASDYLSSEAPEFELRMLQAVEAIFDVSRYDIDDNSQVLEAYNLAVAAYDKALHIDATPGIAYALAASLVQTGEV